LTRPAIRWLFIGSGAQTEKLRRAVQERGHKSVMFCPYQPRERLSESLSVPDVHLISLKPNLEGLIVPSKFYGIAAAGRPTIFVGNPDGELARIIRDSDIGFVIRDGDGAGLAEAIFKLARQPRLAADQGRRARHLFEAKYDFRGEPSAVESGCDLLARNGWKREWRELIVGHGERGRRGEALEEMFFRGYLLHRLDFGGVIGKITALSVHP
jgi:hypothetical protein